MGKGLMEKAVPRPRPLNVEDAGGLAGRQQLESEVMSLKCLSGLLGLEELAQALLVYLALLVQSSGGVWSIIQRQRFRRDEAWIPL